ncbi:MAG: hypothetical protein U1F53_22410 [Burkholderiaceae bacterium]
MKPSEIVAALRAKEPKLLDGLPDKKAEQVLKAAFALVRESVAALDKSDVTIGMLGRFKATEHTKGEGAEATTVRKVTFIAAKPADPAKAEGKAEGKAAAKAEGKAEGKPAAKAKPKA